MSSSLSQVVTNVPPFKAGEFSIMDPSALHSGLNVEESVALPTGSAQLENKPEGVVHAPTASVTCCCVTGIIRVLGSAGEARTSSSSALDASIFKCVIELTLLSSFPLCVRLSFKSLLINYYVPETRQ